MDNTDFGEWILETDNEYYRRVAFVKQTLTIEPSAYDNGCFVTVRISTDGWTDALSSQYFDTNDLDTIFEWADQTAAILMSELNQ